MRRPSSLVFLFCPSACCLRCRTEKQTRKTTKGKKTHRQCCKRCGDRVSISACAGGGVNDVCEHLLTSNLLTHSPHCSTPTPHYTSTHTLLSPRTPPLMCGPLQLAPLVRVTCGVVLRVSSALLCVLQRGELLDCRHRCIIVATQLQLSLLLSLPSSENWAFGAAAVGVNAINIVLNFICSPVKSTQTQCETQSVIYEE